MRMEGVGSVVFAFDRNSLAGILSAFVVYTRVEGRGAHVSLHSIVVRARSHRQAHAAGAMEDEGVEGADSRDR